MFIRELKPKRTWIESVNEKYTIVVNRERAYNRAEWRKRIHVTDPKFGMKALALLLCIYLFIFMVT